MKLLIYSDLHLEFKNPILPPKESAADLLILAGDICVFKDLQPLDTFLKDWNKPAIYIAGNHEYYTNKAMGKGDDALLEYIKTKKPNLTFLRDEAYTLGDVEFFGGTMWTDLNNGNPMDSIWVHSGMNDYKIIRNNNYQKIWPEYTRQLHAAYKSKLVAWLEKNKDKKRVVISHHAPVMNKNTRFGNSKLWSAYNSLDMIPVIEEHQPDLWCYGHTHESDDQMIGRTRIVSNPYGYHNYDPNLQFDYKGLEIVV